MTAVHDTEQQAHCIIPCVSAGGRAVQVLMCVCLPQIGAFHLHQMLAARGVGGEDAAGKVQDILGGFSQAPPFPDVGPALQQLHAAGIKVT